MVVCPDTAEHAGCNERGSTLTCVCPSVRRRPGGLPGLGAEVSGRAPRGAAGLRVVPPGAAPSRTAAHDPPPATTDRRPSRAGFPAAAPPSPRPHPQTAAGDAQRQGLTASCRPFIGETVK